MKRIVKGWLEQDVLTPWRRFYPANQRPGVCAEVKRRHRRRERHDAKQQIRRETE